MDKPRKWINGKMEETSQLWYCWIGAMCGIEILNITLVRKYAPFWVDIVISILLLVIGVYYVSVFYKYMYGKYKNYLEKNKSEILHQLEVFEKRIEELSEEAKKDVEVKYTELSSKVSDYKVEIKNDIDVQSKSTNANIQDKTKQLLENADKLAEETNMAIVHTNKVMDNAFENSNNLVVLKTKELTQLTNKKSEKTEQLILDKFAKQVQSSQDNLLILHNEIKEVFDKDVEGFAKIEATVAETSDNTNKSLEEHFDRVRSNATEKQNELNANINRMVSDLSAELKAASEEIVNTSNQSKKDVIDETYRVSTERHDKEMELINKVFNQVSESYEGMIAQFDQAENSIAGNIGREAFEISSNLVKIEDVINEKHFDSQKQIDEVTDKIVENTNSVVNSNHETLSEQLKEISESVSMQLSNGKNDLIEKVGQHKEKLVEVLEDVLSQTMNKLNEQTEVMSNGIETNQKQLEEAMNKIVDNTNTAVSSNQEKLSVRIKEVAESVTTKISNNKADLIENAKQSNDSLTEAINSVFSQTDAKIDKNAEMITERLETTKETINSLIVAKQSEVLTKLETLNKESASNLKALLEIINSGVEVGIKELAGKVDDSASNVNKAMADEILMVKNKQSEIHQLIDNLITSEKVCQSTVEQATEKFQNQLELLRKEVIDEIFKSVNVVGQLQTADRNARNEVIDSKFNHAYQQIIRLTETLSNRADKLDASVAKTLFVSTAIQENGTKKGDSIFDILCKVLETDNELAMSAKKLGVNQEETASKIDNLKTEMVTLNALVKMLKIVTSEPEKKEKESKVSKKEPNRTEKIHDNESGMTVFNTYKNDFLQHSEMQQLGKTVFSADYNSKGNILLSKNYDKQGKVTMENSYHLNGQVKERKEKIKENGRMVTKIEEFDKNGIKLL